MTDIIDRIVFANVMLICWGPVGLLCIMSMGL